MFQEFIGAGFPPNVAERYVSPHQANAEAFSAGYGVDPVIMLRNRCFICDGQGQADGALTQAIYRSKTDMDMARRQRWRVWSGEFREQLETAGYSANPASTLIP